MQGDGDYLDKSVNAGSVITYLEGMINRNPTFLDTSVVPTLSPQLQERKVDHDLAGKYVIFMDGLVRKLQSPNLYLVPQVRSEIIYRLEEADDCAEAFLKRVNKHAKVDRYQNQVRLAMERIKNLDDFQPTPAYQIVYEFLIRAHDVMNWQKIDHHKGNADDELVAAAIAYSLDTEHETLIISNDRQLNNTALQYHKLLCCKGVENGGLRSLVDRIRNITISNIFFSRESGLFLNFGSTREFYAPFVYRFKDDMKQIWRPGFKDSEKKRVKEEQRLIEDVKETLHLIDECYAVEMNLLQHKDALVPEVRSTPDESDEMAIPAEPIRDLSSLGITEVHNAEEISDISPTDINFKTIRPGDDREKVFSALEEIIRHVDPEPQTQEEMDHSLRGYESVKVLAETLGHKDVEDSAASEAAMIRAKKTGLRIKELDLQITLQRKQYLDLASSVSDAKSAKEAAEAAQNLQELYNRLDALRKK